MFNQVSSNTKRDLSGVNMFACVYANSASAKLTITSIAEELLAVY